MSTPPFAETLEQVAKLHSPLLPPEGMAYLGSNSGEVAKCSGCSCGDPYLDPDWPCKTARIIQGAFPEYKWTTERAVV